MNNTKAYSATSATSPLASTTIARRDPTEHDVQIEILFCGICHSDLHSVRNEWSEFMPTVYPIVPGHEIVGRVTKVGSAVTKYKPGELAAVGCLVDSDRTCPSPSTPRTSTAEASPTVATPIASSSMNTSFCESPPTSISPGPHRSSALASQHIRPCPTEIGRAPV